MSAEGSGFRVYVWSRRLAVPLAQFDFSPVHARWLASNAFAQAIFGAYPAAGRVQIVPLEAIVVDLRVAHRRRELTESEEGALYRRGGAR